MVFRAPIQRSSRIPSKGDSGLLERDLGFLLVISGRFRDDIVGTQTMPHKLE